MDQGLLPALGSGSKSQITSASLSTSERVENICLYATFDNDPWHKRLFLEIFQSKNINKHRHGFSTSPRWGRGFIKGVAAKLTQIRASAHQGHCYTSPSHPKFTEIITLLTRTDIFSLPTISIVILGAFKRCVIPFHCDIF